MAQKRGKDGRFGSGSGSKPSPAARPSSGARIPAVPEAPKAGPDVMGAARTRIETMYAGFRAWKSARSAARG